MILNYRDFELSKGYQILILITNHHRNGELVMHCRQQIIVYRWSPILYKTVLCKRIIFIWVHRMEIKYYVVGLLTTMLS